MKRWEWTLLFCLLFSTVAEASVFSKIKGFLTWELISYIATAVLALVAGGGIIYTKAAKTIEEVGEFLDTLGAAVEDKKITKDELVAIIKEGKEVLSIWKK